MQGPSDDGSCAKYTTMAPCESRKSLFDSSQSYCVTGFVRCASITVQNAAKTAQKMVQTMTVLIDGANIKARASMTHIGTGSADHKDAESNIKVNDSRNAESTTNDVNRLVSTLESEIMTTRKLIIQQQDASGEMLIEFDHGSITWFLCCGSKTSSSKSFASPQSAYPWTTSFQ